MSRFSAIDTAKLGRPSALADLSHKAILDASMADFVARWNEARAKDPSLPPYNVQGLESDPIKLTLRTQAYREVLKRGEINDAVLSASLLFAERGDLDLAAASVATTRVAGEADASLRARALLAWEALSIGGSYGGYEYQARSVAPLDIADVAVWGYEASDADLYGASALTDMDRGEVRIVLLGASQTGGVAPSVISAVQRAFSDRAVRKVNDRVRVVQATLRPYTVEATLYAPRGAPTQPILDAARARAVAYGEAARRIGKQATRGGLLAALMAAEPGLVVDAALRAPAANVGGGLCEAPVLSGVALAVEAAP